MEPEGSSFIPPATSYVLLTNEEANETATTENSSNVRGSGIEKFDSQSKLDLKYLLDNFCKLSEEYITDVYFENKCDLKAAENMLKQLQIQHESLPDRLGIGDTSEYSVAAVDRPSPKKNVAKGSSSSSKSS